MAQILLQLSAQDQARVVKAYASEFGYSPIIGINGNSNPESQAQFSMRMIKEQLQATVKKYEKNLNQTNANDGFDNTFVKPDIT